MGIGTDPLQNVQRASIVYGVGLTVRGPWSRSSVARPPPRRSGAVFTGAEGRKASRHGLPSPGRRAAATTDPSPPDPESHRVSRVSGLLRLPGLEVRAQGAAACVTGGCVGACVAGAQDSQLELKGKQDMTAQTASDADKDETRMGRRRREPRSLAGAHTPCHLPLRPGFLGGGRTRPAPNASWRAPQCGLPAAVRRLEGLTPD